MEEQEFYRVYTRQDKRVWDTLLREGVYRVKEEYIRAKNGDISDFYLQAYRWFTAECGKRITVPLGAEFPIWLSMHEEMRLRNTENTVVLHLRIPREYVLVISEYAWGYRINNLYVPLSAEDERAFNEELSRYGIASESELVTGQLGNFYPLLKRKMLDSFSRVMTLPPRGKFDELGVCFELRKEWIEKLELPE